MVQMSNYMTGELRANQTSVSVSVYLSVCLSPPVSLSVSLCFSYPLSSTIKLEKC